MSKKKNDVMTCDEIKAATLHPFTPLDATAQFLKDNPKRTGDCIVYTLQSGFAKDAGKILDASFKQIEISSDGDGRLFVPMIVNMEEARVRALMKLDGLDLLVLGLL